MKPVKLNLQLFDPLKCNFLNRFEYYIYILTACGKCTSSQKIQCLIYSVLCDSALCHHVNLALVVNINNTLDDIPTKVGQKVKGLPALKSMKISLHNLSNS